MKYFQDALPSFIGTFGALLLLIILTYAYASYAGETLVKAV